MMGIPRHGFHQTACPTLSGPTVLQFGDLLLRALLPSHVISLPASTAAAFIRFNVLFVISEG